jgi:exopolysaccharide production protein ExoQ
LASGSEAALAIIALLFFPLLVLVPRGTAALASVAGLCAAVLVFSSGRRRPGTALALSALLFGCLLMWGALSASWSLNPGRSLIVAARLAGLFAAGLALVAAAGVIALPRRLTWFLLAGMALGIVIAVADLSTGGLVGSIFTDRPYRPTRLNQASISFAILLLPTGAVLVGIGQTVPALLLAAAAAATICALAGTAAKIVLLPGVLMGLLLYYSRSQVARAAAVVSIVAIIAAPLTFARLERVPGLGEAADVAKVSAGHRLLIWSFAGDRIAERPLSGWGLDSSRNIPGGKDPIRAGESWMPLHPHNTALQMWLELGVPGAVLFALLIAFLWYCLASAAEWPRLFTAAAGGSLTIAFVACFATYGIWQEWWLSVLWLSLFLVLVMARAASAERGANLQGEQREPD